MPILWQLDEVHEDSFTGRWKKKNLTMTLEDDTYTAFLCLEQNIHQQSHPRNILQEDRAVVKQIQ
jgi:hypothetical protein